MVMPVVAALGASAAGAAVSSAAGGALNAAGNAVNSAINSLGVRIPAMLVCVQPLAAIGVVPFDFNPDSIEMTRRGKVRVEKNLGGRSTPTGATGAIICQADPPQINLKEIIFEGLTTKMRCDQLLRWIGPYGGLPFPGLSSLTAVNLPVITFSWGPPAVAFMYQVRITNCTINYVRFNTMGMPIRAKISLGMLQEPSLLSSLPTNPTSGGLPNRRTHTFAQGDTLQSLATTYYGRPGAWRQIAAVNRISDPNRVRPGTRIYLPNAEELPAGRP